MRIDIPRMIASPFREPHYELLRGHLQRVMDTAYTVSHGSSVLPAQELGKLKRQITLAIRELEHWQERMGARKRRVRRLRGY